MEFEQGPAPVLKHGLQFPLKTGQLVILSHMLIFTVLWYTKHVIVLPFAANISLATIVFIFTMITVVLYLSLCLGGAQYKKDNNNNNKNNDAIIASEYYFGMPLTRQDCALRLAAFRLFACVLLLVQIGVGFAVFGYYFEDESKMRTIVMRAHHHSTPSVLAAFSFLVALYETVVLVLFVIKVGATTASSSQQSNNVITSS
eukprot:PhM_4_TR4267/c0_g2_i2/m.87298